jgi:hypothetical protein
MTNNINVSSLTSTQNTLQSDTRSTFTQNIIGGNTTILNHTSSSLLYQFNIGGGITVNNNYSSSVSTATNNVNVQGNIFGGAGNTLTISGSNTSNRRNINNNFVFGRTNVINSQHSGSSGGQMSSTMVFGQELIVSASNTSITVGGSVFVGRYNATGSLQESTQDTVFVVGTGTSAGLRRNGLRIDSNSNTTISGSVLIAAPTNFGHQPSLVLGSFSNTNAAANITGSVGVSGSINITGSIMLNGAAVGASDRNGLITTGSG